MDKADVQPGDVFPVEPTLTAQDPSGASELHRLGFHCNSHAWAVGEYFTVGSHQFFWDGLDWQPGVS